MRRPPNRACSHASPRACSGGLQRHFSTRMNEAGRARKRSQTKRYIVGVSAWEERSWEMEARVGGAHVLWISDEATVSAGALHRIGAHARCRAPQYGVEPLSIA